MTEYKSLNTETEQADYQDQPNTNLIQLDIIDVLEDQSNDD